jgi:hypothetical protein
MDWATADRLGRHCQTAVMPTGITRHRRNLTARILAGQQEGWTVTDPVSKDLEHPRQDRAPDGQRQDGRPSEATIEDVRSERTDQHPPTEPPEDTGGAPTTEHGPGGDL